MKKISPMISLVAAVLLLAGLIAPAPALAAKAAPGPSVGYVDRQQVFNSYPGIQDLLRQIQSMREAAQKDYDARSKDLSPGERKVLNDTIAREETQREDALMKPVGDKIEASIKAVAGEKGLPAIVDAGIIVYGGVDITADVIAKVKQ